MKKLLIMLMALAMVAVSCQNDFTPDYTGKDAIVHTISVGIPELDATRADETTGLNSGLGAIDNFNNSTDLWGKYDLRYILEIYDVTENYKNTSDPIKKRDVKILDKYEATSFDVRLVPNRDYRFVLWADFVANGSTPESVVDLHYNTSDFNNITRYEVEAMDESYDAYFIQEDISIGTSGLNKTLTLKRPFGKIRVITTDINEVNFGSEVEKVTVKFYNEYLYTSLNAVSGVANGTAYNEYVEYTVAKDAPYTVGYDAESSNMTLFADYILAGDETKGAQQVNFEMTTWGKDGRQISTRKFESQIPLERNKLTTIIGNLLTIGSEFNIVIDDNFSGEHEINGNPALATPVVSTTVAENVVTLSWEAIEGATNYSVTCGTEMPVFVEGTSYEFTGEYATEYTFTVVALPEDETEYAPSNAAVVTVTTEAEPVVEPEDITLYFSASHWEQDGARFAIYYWDASTVNWADLTLAEGETNIYTVTIPNNYSNVIFCRMNPAGGNEWNYKWNQTKDLTIPTDGSNLFTVTPNQWDGANGVWSVYAKKEEVTATLTFDDKAKRTEFSSELQTWGGEWRNFR